MKESKEIVECCNEAMDASRLGLIAHRWACCVSYDELDSHGNPETVARQHNGAACSPWGPPVPPRMNRARKASPARRDMNIALTAHMGLVA